MEETANEKVLHPVIVRAIKIKKAIEPVVVMRFEKMAELMEDDAIDDILPIGEKTVVELDLLLLREAAAIVA